MKPIITPLLKQKSLLLFLVLLLFFLFPLIATSQTVTNVFPTRVTTSSKVTIIGTGFTTAMRDEIKLNGSESTAVLNSRTLVSTTEMTFVITLTGGSDTVKTLTISGATFNAGVDSTIDYVAPVSKSLNTTSENRVTEVYTTWDRDGDGDVYSAFWKSSDFVAGNTATWPNDSHILLGFKMNYSGNDIIFSTGVNDLLLETELSSLGVDVSGTSTEYIKQDFKAYSTNGVSGKPNSNNYMGFADKIDGYTGSIVLSNAVKRTVYDVIIDGENGLDLGTGIANFNNKANIKFYSGNGDIGAVNDGVPDLLITQIAQPGGSDVYYYADVDGNVVGRPIKLAFVNNNDTRLYQWRVDFFRLDYSASATFETAIPTTASFGNGQSRGFRIAAFSLEDFGIDGSINAEIENIDNINMGAGGSSDMAFMAYNKTAFDIKSPVISKAPISRFVCRLPSVSDLVFSAEGNIEGVGSSDPDIAAREAITYQWFKNNTDLGISTNTFTIPSGLTASDLVGDIYRVRVANEYGAVDLPFTINEGGTPTYWDGSNWVLPEIYTDIVINDEDRNLIFSEDYSQSGNIEGCDCTVLAGKQVVIPGGATMTLFNEIIVEPIIAATIEDGVAVAEVPAGSFTLENTASLVQINDVENSGDIKVKRTASDLNAYDYVYWSSPVEEYNISNIPGDLKYEWHTNAINSNGTYGDWAVASGNMTDARGYIARVPTAANYTSNFIGVPNNGDINFTVYKSGGSMPSANKDWNLIGNPYPSALNADKFLEGNTTIAGSVYLWAHNTPIYASADQPFYQSYGMNYGNQYVAYNSTGTSNPVGEFDGQIASGQAFFVQALSESTVTFTNKMRYDENEDSYSNSGFYRSTTDASVLDNEKQLVWLNLINDNNNAVSTLVGYVEGATEGKDRLYDAKTNNEGFNLYSLISEEKFVIQGLPLPFVDINTVSLGYELLQGGIYSIAIGNVKGNLFEENGQDIFLEDTYSSVIHNLRTSPYTFTGEAGVFNDRFILKYVESSALSVVEVSLANTFAYINNSILYINSSNGIKSVMVYDVNGKQITSYNSNDNINSFRSEFRFSKSVYIAVITLDNGSLVTKKIVN